MKIRTFIMYVCKDFYWATFTICIVVLLCQLFCTTCPRHKTTGECTLILSKVLDSAASATHQCLLILGVSDTYEDNNNGCHGNYKHGGHQSHSDDDVRLDVVHGRVVCLVRADTLTLLVKENVLGGGNGGWTRHFRRRRCGFF